MSPDEPEILIVGAGPTGLVLALWLNRLGVRFRIVDRAAGTGQASRALVVQARTLEFYRAFGLADEVVAEGVPAQAVNLWVRGRKRARVPFGNAGQGLSPYPFALVLPQDVHERILLDRLRADGGRVDWQTELTGFHDDGDGVTAYLRSATGVVEECRFSYLCGCDGARSTVRQELAVDFPGGTYSQIFYVADVEAAGEAVDGELHVSLEATDFCLIFPMNGAGGARLVGLVDRPGTDGENLAYEEVRGGAEQALGLSVGRVNWFSTYHVHHRVADSFRRGRVFLLGDAAHLHSPAGGQGMNTGIGDAVNLSWKLAMVLDGRAGDGLLDTYQAERIAFARRLVRTTDQAFRAAVDPSRLGQFIRMNGLPILLQVVGTWRALWRFAFHTVSQISIAYRRSRLSDGRAGTVRGGERLPWLATTAGSNFDPLRSLGWQIHVYGRVRAGLADWCKRRGVPLHAFEYEHEARQAGFGRDAAYLVRPDGHVACAVADQDTGAFERFLAARGLSLGMPVRPQDR